MNSWSGKLQIKHSSFTNTQYINSSSIDERCTIICLHVAWSAIERGLENSTYLQQQSLIEIESCFYIGNEQIEDPIDFC